MPSKGQQGGDASSRAVAHLRNTGHVRISSRDLAIVLEDVSERYDSAMVDDVLSVVATMVMDRMGDTGAGPADRL